MKNNFFYSKSGLSASMLFNKLCETARIYSNYERIIKYTYRVNARVYTRYNRNVMLTIKKYRILSINFIKFIFEQKNETLHSGTCCVTSTYWS